MPALRPVANGKEMDLDKPALNRQLQQTLAQIPGKNLREERKNIKPHMRQLQMSCYWSQLQIRNLYSVISNPVTYSEAGAAASTPGEASPASAGAASAAGASSACFFGLGVNRGGPGSGTTFGAFS